MLAPRPGATATVVIHFASGAVDDALPGATRVAQQALLAANARLDLRGYAADVHAAGATLDVRTGQRDAWFALTTDRRDFPRLARPLLEAVLAPRFLPARMPDVIARAALDVPARPDALQFLTQLDLADARYMNPDVGTPEEVEAIAAQHVVRALAERLSAANATVVFAGAFDRDAVLVWTRALQGGRSSPGGRAELPVPFSTRRGAAQELHILAFPLTLRDAADSAAARVAAALLHDELWTSFRRRGVAYSFEVDAIHRRWIDVLVLMLAANDPSVDMGGALGEAVNRLRTGTFGDRELERARAAVQRELSLVDSDPSALALELARGGPVWHGSGVVHALAQLDRLALAAQLRSWLDPSRAITIYLGPRP